MAKVPFSKLDLKPNADINKLSVFNSKNEEIQFEVKSYLPVQEKMELISNIINQSIDDNDFYNPIRVQIFTVLEVVSAYTNLSFTAKQKEDPFKIYDLLVGSNIFKKVIENIKEDDWKEIQETVMTVIENVYKYKNSAKGIMEAITNDYDNLNLDATNIQKALGDPENLTLLKNVVTKLG